MLQVDQGSLKYVVVIELERLLRSNPFVMRIFTQLGAALHERLVDWPFEDETEFSRHDPVVALYEWLVGGWSLDPEWLSTEDGKWLDDNGEVLPSTIRQSFTAAEQLAAYGLWLVKVEFPSVGPVPTKGVGPRGWKREDVLLHRATCISLAYQSLTYAQAILLGTELSKEEVARSIRAATARNAADALHNLPGGSRQKRAEIRLLWATGRYSSRDICAEQECGALGMSFSTARKALIRAPEPPSRSE